jgi:hypothetical protein
MADQPKIVLAHGAWADGSSWSAAATAVPVSMWRRPAEPASEPRSLSDTGLSRPGGRHVPVGSQRAHDDQR